MVKSNIVSDNIRQLRIKAGLTQEELGLRSGLSQGYINQLESGKRRYTQKSLELIANALGMKITEFFTEEGLSGIAVVKKKDATHDRRRSNKKEFLRLLNELPQHIVEHYLILLRLEKAVWRKMPHG